MPIPPFEPHPWIRGGTAQTIAGQWRWPQPRLGAYEGVTVALSDGDKIVLHVNPGEDASSPIVMLLHGLGGDSESSYVLRLTAKMTARGTTVVRFNHRGCGRGAHGLARDIYHAGRIADVAAAVDYVNSRWPGRPLLVAAFSLSGNMLLRLLGEDPARAAGISRAMAVCSPVDLEHCSLALASPDNKLIDRYYTRRLVRTAEGRVVLFPDLPKPVWPQGLNLREFDAVYTAPLAGFPTRDAYYAHSSSKPHLARITVPTLLLGAKDDPVVPERSYDGMELSPAVTFRLEKSGGHMGFISASPTPHGDRRWMDYAVMEWALGS